MNSSNIKYASFFERLFAFIIDALFCFFVSGFLCYYIVDGQSRFYLVENKMISNMICLVFFVIYFATLESSNWQGTLGKYILKIKIVDASNFQTISFTQSLRRFLGRSVSVLPLFFGIIILLKDKKNQTWHDKISNTIVLHLEEKQ